MRRYKYAALLGVCIFLIILNCGCIENDRDEPIVMTFGELIDDFQNTYNWEAAYRTENFTSLTDGDNLIIRDQIYNITYREDEDFTEIEFNSSAGLENFFPIAGNITDRFKVGDTVEIHLHIIKVTFTTTENNRTITNEIETFEEGWDTDSNEYVPVPSKYLSLIDKAID